MVRYVSGPEWSIAVKDQYGPLFMPMNRPDQQFKLRLPVELKARLEESATAGGRSLTAEIVHRLEQSFHAGSVLSVEHVLVMASTNVEGSRRLNQEKLAALQAAEKDGEQWDRPWPRQQLIDHHAKAKNRLLGMTYDVDNLIYEASQRSAEGNPMSLDELKSRLLAIGINLPI